MRRFKIGDVIFYKDVNAYYTVIEVVVDNYHLTNGKGEVFSEGHHLVESLCVLTTKSLLKNL